MAENLKIAIVLSAVDKLSSVFNKTMDSNIKKLESFSKKSKDIGEKARNLGESAGKLGLFLAAPFGLAIKSAADFEKSQISLRTAFQGNIKAADAAFKTINQFAAQTPYELDEVLRGYIKLKNMGLDPGTKALTAYGNTASAMGKSLNDMVEAVADAATGEFERLKEFGIKASQQGNKVTFLFQGVKTTVNKNAKDIEKYLIGLGNTKFAGGITAQSKSVHGQISTLKDSVTMTASKIGAHLVPKLNELFKTLTPTLDKIMKWVERNPELTNTILKVTGALAALSLTVSGVSFLVSGVATTVSTVTKHFGTFMKVLKGVGNAILFVGKTVLQLTQFMLENPILLIIMAIAVAAFLIYKYWDQIKAFFVRLWNGIKEIFSRAWDFIKNLFFNYHPLGIIIKNWDAIVDWFKNLWEKVKEKFNAFIDFVKSIPSKMYEAGKNIVKSIWEGIKSFASKPIEAIKNIVKKIRDHLPFSPAKEGPLRDIHKIRLVETIAESVKPGPLVRAMRVTTAAAMVAAAPISAQGVPSRNNGGGGITLHYSPTVTISGGSPSAVIDFRAELQKHSKEIYKMLQEEMRKQGRTDFKK